MVIRGWGWGRGGSDFFWWVHLVFVITIIEFNMIVPGLPTPDRNKPKIS